GICLQASLRRTREDVDHLIAAGARIRLVKGAYKEPPDIAHGSRSEIDSAYLKHLETLFARGRDFSVASHDRRIIQRSLELTRQRTAYGDPRVVGEFGGGGSEIRILFAIAHLGKGGGVALQAFQLFKILQRTVDVQLVCLDAPGPHRGLTQEPGVIVAGPLVFPRGIQTLAQALRSSRRDHDVFHARSEEHTSEL